MHVGKNFCHVLVVCQKLLYLVYAKCYKALLTSQDFMLTLYITHLQNREQNKPLVLGATVDEGMIFVSEAFPFPVNDTAYRVLAKLFFKEDFDAVITRYPPEVYYHYLLYDIMQLLLFILYLFIFILHSRESELYCYILDGTSALAWELPFFEVSGPPVFHIKASR